MNDVLPDDYALAIGHTILASNTVEAELFSLLLDLGCREPGLEAARFSDKIRELRTFAALEPDGQLAAHLSNLADDASALKDERNNFAHGLPWLDPYDGSH